MEITFTGGPTFSTGQNLQRTTRQEDLFAPDFANRFLTMQFWMKEKESDVLRNVR